MAQMARAGYAIAPFEREDLAANAEMLEIAPKLLAWKTESLVRFCSCVLCDNSKRLEDLAAVEKGGEFRGKLRGKLGRILQEITGGAICTLDELGILPNPRSVLVHGPLQLRFDSESLDLSCLEGACRLSQVDIERAGEITTAARRCLTIENETSFHELAKLRSGELLVHTSYPGSGTIAFLKRLRHGSSAGTLATAMRMASKSSAYCARKLAASFSHCTWSAGDCASSRRHSDLPRVATGLFMADTSPNIPLSASTRGTRTYVPSARF
jgi:hypothetical protein